MVESYSKSMFRTVSKLGKQISLRPFLLWIMKVPLPVLKFSLFGLSYSEANNWAIGNKKLNCLISSNELLFVTVRKNGKKLVKQIPPTSTTPNSNAFTRASCLAYFGFCSRLARNCAQEKNCLPAFVTCTCLLTLAPCGRLLIHSLATPTR